MDRLSITRLAVYCLSLLAGVGAAWAASQGWGTYDTATGMFDPHPINLNAVIAGAVSAVGNALAAVAVLRGWGKK